jgi:hypothetical protein
VDVTGHELSSHHGVPAWIIAVLAMVPGSLLAWWMWFSPGQFIQLLGASIALLIAGVILLTQQRTRSVGLGLIIGFATCYFTVVAPGLLTAVLRML